jgi:hypothetical protein
VAIQEFRVDAELSDRFVRYGYDCYRGDRLWIPPLQSTVRASLAPDNPFLQRPGNDQRNFLAQVGSRTVGRVSAWVNADMVDAESKAVGCIGHFEADNDPTVANDLLATARDWLRREHGLRRVWGPLQGDIWHGYRLMTKGFGERPFAGEPYNRPYYPNLFERAGFVVKQHWHSFESAGWDSCDQLRRRGAERLEALRAKGYRFVPLDLRHFDDEIKKLHALLLASYAGFPGFTAIGAGEFARLAAPLRHAVLADAFFFVRDQQGELCGFAAALLDLSDALRAMGGSSTAIAKAKFYFHRQRANRVMFYLIGLTPAEAAKRNGLGSALVSRVLDGLAEGGYQTFIAALMAAGTRSRGLLDGLSGDSDREYALYEWSDA